MIVGLILIFLLSFFVVCFFIQQIILICYKKNLFDEPTEVRKVHIRRTPNLGGVSVFATLIMVSCFFPASAEVPHLNYLIFSGLLLFFTGMADDLIWVSATKKVVVQAVVALVLTFMANCRFTSFAGLFGLNEIPYQLSVVLSPIFIILMINAFNLIDGINCLAASLALMICLFSAYYFQRMQLYAFAHIAISFAGCLAGFILFNKTPARIFLGDSGSTFIGFLVSVFCIYLINYKPTETILAGIPNAGLTPAIIVAFIIIPVFDTISVFSLRIINGKNPFEADRNHIHHRMLDAGFSHIKTTGLLLVVNISIIFSTILLQSIRSEILIVMIILLVLLLNKMLSIFSTAAANRRVREEKREVIALANGKLKVLVREQAVLE